MKWLIIQSDGEHKGQDDWAPNWFLRECYSIQDALLRNGEQADIWGLRHANYGTVPDFESYDIIFLAENYEWDWLPDFSRIKRPKLIQWIIDLHCQPWHNYAGVSQHADLVLHATRGSAEPLTRNSMTQYAYAVCQPTNQHIWCPNAIDDRYFRPADRERILGVSFVGSKGPTNSVRRDAIDRMIEKAFLCYDYGVTGYAYIDRLQRSKFGFNKNLNGDLNYRTFEVLACGAALITERDPCLTDLGFVHGLNCLLYDSIDEAVDLANAGHDWRAIGIEGHKLSKQHTYAKRIETLLWTLRQSNTLTPT